MEVRERLRDLLRQKRWSQSTLARALGEHRNWVGDRIRGDVAIKADEIPIMARALGIPCIRFFESTECPEFARPAEVGGAPSPKVPSTAAEIAIQLSRDPEFHAAFLEVLAQALKRFYPEDGTESRPA